MSMEIDGTGLNESRAFACELVAWQFLTYLSEKELIDYLLFELPTFDPATEQPGSSGNGRKNRPSADSQQDDVDESTGLLQQQQQHTTLSPKQFGPPRQDLVSSSSDAQEDVRIARTTADGDIGVSVQGLNALEIAAVANAK